jgi:hypothetical protein
MSFEAIEWFDMQKQSQVAVFGAFCPQCPIESEHSVHDGIDLKLWLFEELLAFRDFQLNTITNC